MGQTLVIVESPAKIKTLTNFLGSQYKVMASMGHVRDLPKTTLGVDIEGGFLPTYRNIPDRKKTLDDLQKAVGRFKTVYLASDPDREGEAIAWHLAQALKLTDPKRIEFNEITRNAVETALQNPRSINMDRVDSQQARRVLDRLVGYKLSPLLWKKVRPHLSAGRVQSVAVRIIVDREREIDRFQPEEYWSVTALLTPQDRDTPFEARLIQQHGKKLEIHNGDEIAAIKTALDGAPYQVQTVKPREKVRNPSPPFITSTLQQEAAIKLGFGARKTMTVAQQLYEGLDLGEEGTVGLITYMRTDSTRVATEAQEEARQYIESTFGKDYIPDKPREFKARKNAQEAHEAIRPTSVFRHPDMVSGALAKDQYRLYRLIWERFVASQMRAAILDVMTVDISANEFTFRANGSTVKFPGFMRLYTEGRDEATPANPDEEAEGQLPALTAGELLNLLKLTDKQHFTEPPPRYSEATLVKALEERAIGRPSTYASIVQTIQTRGYVILDNKRFKPTETGYAVTDLLVKHFPDIMDVEFTAQMEKELDRVEEGEVDWGGLLADFYPPFSEKLTAAEQTAEVVKMEPRITDEVCPDCGKPMAVKRSKHGEFLGCTGYPECKKTMSLAVTKKVGVMCPDCHEGEIIEKRSRRGKTFFGCNRWPECKFAAWLKPVDQRCPLCNYLMGERTGKNRDLACLNAECTLAVRAPVKKVVEGEETAAGTETGGTTTNGARPVRAKTATTKAAATKAAASKKTATTKAATVKKAPAKKAATATGTAVKPTRTRAPKPEESIGKAAPVAARKAASREKVVA
ncbi:MAG: type I DNA topoisomerase [Armatimonadota bacterium]|nr:type I DNA topoisomerase [Armatimonadota bacterium]